METFLFYLSANFAMPNMNILLGKPHIDTLRTTMKELQKNLPLMRKECNYVADTLSESKVCDSTYDYIETTIDEILFFLNKTKKNKKSNINSESIATKLFLHLEHYIESNRDLEYKLDLLREEIRESKKK